MNFIIWATLVYMYKLKYICTVNDIKKLWIFYVFYQNNGNFDKGLKWILSLIKKLLDTLFEF